MKTLLILITFLSFGFAHADFKAKITSAQHSCPGLTCRDQSIQAVAMTGDEMKNLKLKTSQKLELAAWDLAQIWGDTILEGDYVAHDDVHIDKLEKVMEGPQHIGYRVTYSSLAWDISDCNYEPEQPHTREDCVPGRIVERGFVSMNLISKFRDETRMAEFVE